MDAEMEYEPEEFEDIEYPVIIPQSKEILKLRLQVLGFLTILLTVLTMMMTRGIRWLINDPVEHVLLRVLMYGGIALTVYLVSAYLLKLQWQSVRYKVWQNQIEFETGVFKTESNSYTLTQFNIINVKQSALGKRKGYGDVILTFFSGDTQRIIRYVEGPHVLRRLLLYARSFERVSGVIG